MLYFCKEKYVDVIRPLPEPEKEKIVSAESVISLKSVLKKYSLIGKPFLILTVLNINIVNC